MVVSDGTARRSEIAVRPMSGKKSRITNQELNAYPGESDNRKARRKALTSVGAFLFPKLEA